jgi:hypothetical protein
MNSTKLYIARILGAPLALLGGWAGTQVVSHVNVVSTLGLGKSDIANAVVATGVFLASAAVTFLSHHKGVDHILGKVAGTTTAVATGVGAVLAAPTDPASDPVVSFAGVRADVPPGG